MKPMDTCKGFKLCPFNFIIAISVVLSLVHQTDEDLALKSLKIMVNKELNEVVSFKTFSKFDKKISNSKLSSIGSYIQPGSNRGHFLDH